MYIALSTHTTAKDNMRRGNLQLGGGLSRCSHLPSYVVFIKFVMFKFMNCMNFMKFSRAYFYYTAYLHDTVVIDVTVVTVVI